MTMQLANFWVSKFESYIERNQGSGRQRYSGNIWQTRHAGKNCKVCLRTVASHCTNTLLWMSLPWCLRNCSLELRKRLCDQIIWQRNLGHCKNSWEQVKNWNWTNQGTNVDWSLRYSGTFPPALQPKFYIYTMICSQMATSLRVGDGLCSRCWRNSRGPLGRPAMNWTTKFEQFSRLKHWRDWKEVATDADRWMMEADNFIKFCTQ